MPDLPAPVASAVVVPKQDAPNVKSPRRKRRQSSVSEEASKRPRISTEGSVGSPSTLHSSPQATDSLKHESSGKTQRLTVVPEGSRNVNPERRRSSVQEERKRGQRLFGGLLNTLNQSTPNGQQKKRQEIEARQKERAAQRKVEAEVKRKEKLANLRAVRMVEQVKFQEESYYKPWQLSVRNEATIKAQIEKVEILIEEEKSEWARQHQEQGLKVEEEFESSQVKTEKDNLEEHNGEVVVEAEEDTVIY
ncbi:hypothetical protein SS1G_13651 [Sclerotinia sclerotiorum 1980 UF-70]|uniref:Pinin/SDK/MemA protein domain-containing protein n=1 Tax=Sclerotinia sclerotiorum (strain ATCC 18683 / 1980 / Ss-1) TaxID=665079 RepID=A7F7S1_SCLS1|nr:hypothetical protein SS1G_13651 [Sclerotinia sclerotiorum 1980 UF-70]EDN98792.1 hypothetical protein SS1G_13651 [Sclerotinia sclerotiorum 1980 UF-70]